MSEFAIITTPQNTTGVLVTDKVLVQRGGIAQWGQAKDSGAIFAPSYETRAAFATGIASGITWPNGAIVDAGGVSYVAVSGSTVISDLPGFEPYGRLSILHFGAYSASNNSPALQAAVDYLLDLTRNEGGTIYIPSGSWPFQTEVLIDTSAITGLPNSNYKGVNIVGNGQHSTILKAQTDGMNIIRFLGASPLTTGSYVYGGVSNLTLAGNSATSRTTFGVEFEDVAFWWLRDVGALNLEAGVVLTGGLSGEIWGCDMRESKYGITGTASASHVNSIGIYGSRIQQCTQRGISITGGCSNIVIQGGSVELCGTHGDSATGGVYLSGSGSQGEMSLVCNGGYIENNAGGFDVSINETGGNKMVASIQGVGFQRTSSSSYVTNNIVLTGDVILNDLGNAFTKGGTYSADAARPYINKGANAQVVSIGSRYEDAVEAPRTDASAAYGGFVQGTLGGSSPGDAIAGTTELPNGWSAEWRAAGIIRVNHTLGTTSYAVTATTTGGDDRRVERTQPRNANYFEVVIGNAAGTNTDYDFTFTLVKFGGAS